MSEATRNFHCADCGYEYPYYVMDFVHGKKSFELSEVGQAKRAGFGRIQRELAKYDVVCANCHRRRIHG